MCLKVATRAFKSGKYYAFVVKNVILTLLNNYPTREGGGKLFLSPNQISSTGAVNTYTLMTFNPTPRLYLPKRILPPAFTKISEIAKNVAFYT